MSLKSAADGFSKWKPLAHLPVQQSRDIIQAPSGMIGFDGEGWSWMASRGALPSLTTEHTLQSAKNTWIPVPQAALAAAPMAA